MTRNSISPLKRSITYSVAAWNKNSILFVIIFWIGVSIILTVFLLSDLIWNSGFIYTRDLILPADLSLSFSDLTDTWDNIHSHRNLELNKIPLFLLLSAVDELIGSENTQKLFLGAVIFSVLFVIFISLLLVFKEKVKSNIKLIAICAPPSLLYLFNPWVADRISNHIFMVLGMALTPLVIITYVNLLNRGGVGGGGRRSYLKIFSVSLLLTGLSAASTHNVHYVIPILVFISGYYILVAPNEKRKKVLLSSILFFSFYICLSSYWIVPLIYVSSMVQIVPSYDFSVNEIERLSQLNTFPNVVQMIGGGAWELPFISLYAQSYYFAFLIPIFSLFAIAFFPSNKFVILLAIMLICFILLALGTHTPLPYWASSSLLLSDVLWLFRDPSRFIQFIVLIYSILLAFTLYRIISAKNLPKIISVLLISFVLISISTSFSAYTFVNSAGGRLAPSMLPAALTDLNSFLDNDTGNYKVLWLPLRNYLIYDWNKISEEVAGNIYLQSSPKATYDAVSTEASIDASNFLRNVYSDVILRYKTDQIGQLLNIYGIKYVIVFTDLVGQQDVEAEKIVRIMDRQQDMEFVNQFGPYYVYRNLVFDSDNSPQFYASTMSAVISNYTARELESVVTFWQTQEEESPNPDLELIYQGPTRYLLRVNSTTPFLLVFTETYDPLWKIKIDGSPFVDPILVYYFLNGFAIDEPGQHIIELEYTPQTWFNIGVIITVSTLLVFLSYGIIYKFKGRSSLQPIDIRSNSSILSETFAYRDILVRLRHIKQYFSKRS